MKDQSLNALKLNTMNRMFQLIIFFIGIISVSSCNSPSNEEVAIKEYFSKYTPNLDLNNYKYIVFFPASQCQNCYRIDGKMYKNGELDSVLIITEFLKAFQDVPHFYFDNKNNITRMKWVDYQNQIVKLKDGTIQGTKIISSDDVYEIPQILRNLDDYYVKK